VLVQRHRRHLAQLGQVLEALSPQHLLRRGFCLVRGQSGAVVRSVHQVEAGTLVSLHWSDGQAEARITARAGD
jgi:exodeoxyribonuclease VII large subunit